jgi:hypothetical protein
MLLPIPVLAVLFVPLVVVNSKPPSAKAGRGLPSIYKKWLHFLAPDDYITATTFYASHH